MSAQIIDGKQKFVIDPFNYVKYLLENYNNQKLSDIINILSKLLGLTRYDSSACKITLYVRPSFEKVVTLFEASKVSIVRVTDSAETPSSYALSLFICKLSLGFVIL